MAGLRIPKGPSVVDKAEWDRVVATVPPGLVGLNQLVETGRLELVKEGAQKAGSKEMLAKGEEPADLPTPAKKPATSKKRSSKSKN